MHKLHGGATLGGGGGACTTESWGPWGPCSVSCGLGRATRQRQYLWPARAYAEACRVALTDYKRCHGPRMHCRYVVYFYLLIYPLYALISYFFLN